MFDMLLTQTTAAIRQTVSPGTPGSLTQAVARQGFVLTSKPLRKARSETAQVIEPFERGDDKARNRTEPAKTPRNGSAEILKIQNDGEAVRVRSELARDLIERVSQLRPLVGDVSLATNIGLLKRDLTRCHDALKNYPAERNYLSIVTLVESAMAQLKWKQYTGQQLEAIRQALDIGYRQVKVGFADYEKARTLFSQQNVDATPRIDLEALKWEDITDDDQD
jgi:hypothetical protein